MIGMNLTRRRFATLLAAFGLATPYRTVAATEAKSGKSLTVIELFTSEGCWSCPPAEKKLAEIADDPDILALAYHVDYWDYIGWPDPFANPEYTRRQRRYAGYFQSRTVYTPHQVDGAGEYWLHRALLPGEYHLEVTLGGELRTFPFSVSAGGAADVFLEP